MKRRADRRIKKAKQRRIAQERKAAKRRKAAPITEADIEEYLFSW
jgi:hypothetical protein